MKYSFLFTFLAFAFSSHLFAQNEIEVAAVKKGIYFSDYFSFHGKDNLGKVYFALDNNRKIKGKKIKANNFLFLDSDGSYKELEGEEKYKTEVVDLRTMPNSEHFQFEYKNGAVYKIKSPTNGFELVFDEPLTKTGDYGEGKIIFDIFTAPATMYFNDRIIKGNIVSEKLIDIYGAMKFKTMAKAAIGGMTFDGYYLNVQGLGDLYIHLAKSKLELTVFNANVFNFKTTTKTFDLQIKDDQYIISKYKKLGKRKLPLDFEILTDDLKLTLSTLNFHTYRKFPFAFGMGTLEGTLELDGKVYPVFGLSELIKI